MEKFLPWLDQAKGSTYLKFLSAAQANAKNQSIHYMQLTGKDQPFLERMERLLEIIDYRSEWFKEVVLIGGTAGKGSVTNYLQQILYANNISSGAFYSPAVLSECETIMHRPGDCIPIDVLAEIYLNLLASVKAKELSASHFELMLATALIHFKNNRCTHALLEVGCGGACDATNAVAHTTAVLTNVGSDHIPLMGADRLELAEEKLGIVSANGVLVCGESDPKLRPVIQKTCHDMRARLVMMPNESNAGTSDFEANNQALAIQTAATAFNINHHQNNLRLDLPGRMEMIRLANGASIIIDGAHNFDKCAALVNKLKSQGIERAAILLAVKADKDLVKMVQALEPIADQYYATQATSELNGETLPATLLAKQLRQLSSQPVYVCDHFTSALPELLTGLDKDKPLLVTGSFLMVRPTLECLRECR